MAEPKDQKLWERVKKKITKSSKGGPSGKWTARKAQLAVQEYKRKGGRYKGKKQGTSLNKWGKQNWRYSSQAMKKKGGRYLPAAVWEQLTPQQKRKTNQNKINGKGDVPYEPFVKRAFQKAGVKMD